MMGRVPPPTFWKGNITAWIPRFPVEQIPQRERYALARRIAVAEKSAARVSARAQRVTRCRLDKAQSDPQPAIRDHR